MRFVSSLVRTLTTTCSAALVALAVAAPAHAAPASPQRTAGPTCDPQATTLRKLPRHPKSFGGPLKTAASLQFGLTDPTARVRRATRTNFDSNEAAIQNDAPAAHIDGDGRPVHSLLLLGVLPLAGDSRPRSPTFSPRAPRGPPLPL
jgi:hypothetical protein